LLISINQPRVGESGARLFQKFFARQLAAPSGLIGRRIIAPWLNRANARMNQLTLDQLALQRGDRILEVGFGGGDLLERMLSTKTAARIAGLDRSADMVAVVSQRLKKYISAGELELKCGEVDHLPYAANEFSKLCSVNTLYFWHDSKAALTGCHRVLEKGGQITLCFNDKKDLEAWPTHKHGFRLYEVGEVEALLSAAGFSAIQVISASDEDQGLVHCVSGTAS
jgi:arsenite methyltransferase